MTKFLKVGTECLGRILWRDVRMYGSPPSPGLQTDTNLQGSGAPPAPPPSGILSTSAPRFSPDCPGGIGMANLESQCQDLSWEYMWVGIGLVGFIFWALFPRTRSIELQESDACKLRDGCLQLPKSTTFPRDDAERKRERERTRR